MMLFEYQSDLLNNQSFSMNQFLSQRQKNDFFLGGRTYVDVGVMEEKVCKIGRV